MESNNSNSSPIVKMIPVLIIFAGLLGLYYLYQYLFGPKLNNAYPLITSTQPGNPDKPLTFTTAQIPPLYEGGEFSISSWIYITDWSSGSNKGYNKPIIIIGGKNYDTLRIYLGAYTPKLYVRVHTFENDPSASGSTSGSASGSALGSTSDNSNIQGDSLKTETHNLVFNTLQTESGLLDHSHMCDIPELPLQRWVNFTVCVNGKTLDVYIDGKLSRSCILPHVFKVDTSGYSAVMLGILDKDSKITHGNGFNGKISTTTMYDSALNPEIVYKNYMAGPEPITSIGGLFSSFFAPNIKISIS